jgi:hypothetical protein
MSFQSGAKQRVTSAKRHLLRPGSRSDLMYRSADAKVRVTSLLEGGSGPKGSARLYLHRLVPGGRYVPIPRRSHG